MRLGPEKSLHLPANEETQISIAGGLRLDGTGLLELSPHFDAGAAVVAGQAKREQLCGKSLRWTAKPRSALLGSVNTATSLHSG